MKSRFNAGPCCFHFDIHYSLFGIHDFIVEMAALTLLQMPSALKLSLSHTGERDIETASKNCVCHSIRAR